MYQPTKEEIEKLNGLDADYRFASISAKAENGPPTGAIMKWNAEEGKRVRVDVSGQCVCIITDRQTGQDYGFGYGISEEVAFGDAILDAVASPKPLTRAQQFEVQAGEASKRAELLLESNSLLQRELDATKAKLAEMESTSKNGMRQAGNKRGGGVISQEAAVG